MEKLSASAVIEHKIGKSRVRFQVIIGLAVVLLSFLYGLGSGLNKKIGVAHARPSAVDQFVDSDSAKIPARLTLPRGVKVSPVGSEVTINNRSADVVSFVSARGVEKLIEDQRALWRKRGLEESGMATARRGVAVGIDRKTGTRYSATVWVVPPTIRKAVSGGLPVQGMLVAIDQQESSSVNDSGVQGVSTESINQGEVPGIPTRPGGRGGAVFSSNDPSGRTFSGVYTNPGNVIDNVAYYREALTLSGWAEDSANFHGDAEKGVGDMVFSKDEHEASLIFAPSLAGSDSEEKTTIMVTLLPRQESIR